MKRVGWLMVVMAALVSNTAFAANYRIMVVTWNGCEAACQGFQDGLRDRHIEAELLLRDANKQVSTLPGFVAEAQAKKVDLIVTYGTNVSVGMAGTVDEAPRPGIDRSIPKVFMVVADPEGVGLVRSLDAPGRPDVTGTFNRVPETVNIETIRTYQPGFKRLGMLVVRSEKNSLVKRDEMEKLGTTLGYAVVTRDVALDASGKADPEDIVAQVRALKDAGADFIYVGSSSFLREFRDRFTKAAAEAGLPVLSPYEVLVRESDGLISVSARYEEIGQLAAEQARRILVDGVKAGDLPIARMTRFAVVINMRVAKQIKAIPPIELLQVAEIVN